MKVLELIKNKNSNSPLETLLIGVFAVIFAIWVLTILPLFGNNGPWLIVTCLGLGFWFLFSELVKMSPFFENRRFKLLLLIADTLIFGSLIIFLVHLFHALSVSMKVEFLLFLPAVSLPLYYDFIPGLFSIIPIYLVYFIVSYFDKIDFGHGKIFLQILSYLLVYILISLTMKKKAEANEKLARSVEKVKNLDKAKDTFIATASHELKGPVTILSGYLSMIKNDNLKPKELKNAIANADEGAQNLVHLTKRLFDINRIRLNKLELNIDTLSADLFCKKIIDDYQATNLNSSLQFIYKKINPIPPICADQELLKEVIINLLNNAVKFTPKGEISLTVKDNGNEIVFSVKDTGSGIGKEDQGKIFNKFYQTKESAAEHIGLGLGLHLCHEIVEAHHGKIWLESTVGKGSTFSFSIPKTTCPVKS
jgi:signal transduction histidine kinase